MQENAKGASAPFFVLNPEQSATAEPAGSALLRLAELDTDISATAELLTLADARAIWRELNTVARTLKQVSYPKPSRRRAANAATNMVPTQGDLLG